jgi:hypothetical protein
LLLLPLLDHALLVLVIPLLIARCLGRTALLAYLLLYFGNPLAAYGWTTGSFFRADWVAALFGGLLALQRRHFATAGAFLAAAAAWRIFPGAFALAAFLVVAGTRPFEREALRRLVIGGAAAGLGFILATLLLYGSGAWLEFIDLLHLRISPYGNNSIGLAKIATFYNVLNWPAFSGGAEALESLQRWIESARSDGTAQALALLVCRCGLLAATLLAARRLALLPATIVLGTTLIFVLSAPFSYYYVFLALLSLGAVLAAPTQRVPIYAVSALAIIGLRLMSVPLQSELGYEPSYFSATYQQSRVILLLLLALLAIPAWRGARAHGKVTARLLASAVVLVLLVAASSFRLRPFDTPGYIALPDLGTWRAAGTSSVRRPATASWPEHGYYELHFASPDVALGIDLDTLTPGIYRTSVLYTDGRDLGAFQLELGGHRSVIQAADKGKSVRTPRVRSLGDLHLNASSVLRLAPLPGTSAPIAISGLVLEPQSLP